MTVLHITLGVTVVAANGLTFLYGGTCWVRQLNSRLFWILLRLSQFVVIVQISVGGILLVLGQRVSSLHLMYGALPVLVSFMAEQLRLATAETVLDSEGFRSIDELRSADEKTQHQLAQMIMRRELAIMTLSALVITVLAWRAGQSAGGF